MQLTQLIYASRISDSFTTDDIQSIVASAKKNNPSAGITGLLYFNRHYFFQCIEGARTEVNQLYHKIAQDSRHKDVTLLSYDTITKREFPRWQMGYLPASELTESAYIHYSNNAVFNPYLMSGESAHGLILELRNILQNKPTAAETKQQTQQPVPANQAAQTQAKTTESASVNMAKEPSTEKPTPPSSANPTS